MAISEIYVDPSIAADSGAGTVGDPFGDLEYAIEQTTFDTTNGTRVNIKAGATETLAAKLDTAMADTVTTAAWAPTNAAPCIFQGYTTAAGDGGKGDVSGGGAVSVFASTTFDYVYFVDLKLHNTGANTIVQGDNYCKVRRCHIENTTGDGVFLDQAGDIVDNYFTNIGNTCARTQGGNILGNIFQDNVSNSFAQTSTYVVYMANFGGQVSRNIFQLSSAFADIAIYDIVGCVIENNSIWANGSTGTGIRLLRDGSSVTNNLIEGFSGVGGEGLLIDSGITMLAYGGNSYYNNATDVSGTLEVALDYGGSESLTVSPFTDAANLDFSPVDTGSVKEGSLPAVLGGGYV